MKFGRSWLAAGGAVALLAAVACTPSGDSDDGELVWALGGSEANPGGVHHTVVALWNEQNPDLQVRIETLPEAADQQRQQQAQQLQAGSSSFDILGVDVIWTGEYSENGWIESLEDVRAEIESVTLPGPFESATWGGELWAAPYNSNAGFLYYRTDLVDEPPTSWQEMCDIATTVAGEEGINGFVGQGARYEGFVVNWLEYYWSGGGELFNADQSAVDFNVDLAVEVTEFMADGLGTCFAPGFNTAQEEEARNEFQSGNAVFMRNWPYAYGLIEDDADSPANGNFAVAPLPTWTGTGTISALGGFNNAVSAFSDNIEGAKRFVVWAATDPEAQALLATEGSVPPSMASVYDDLASDPVMALLGEVLADARARPPSPAWNDISLEMQRALFDAYNGESDPRAAAETVRDYLQTTLS